MDRDILTLDTIVAIERLNENVDLTDVGHEAHHVYDDIHESDDRYDDYKL